MAKVKCVVCGEMLDRETEENIRVSKRRWAHDFCALLEGLEPYKEPSDQDIIKQKEKTLIIDQIHSMMKEVLGNDYSRTKITRNINQLIKNGRTEVGILNALKYWYGVKKSDPSKANGGIVIVDYIYGEAQDYWARQKELQESNKNIETKVTTKHYYVKPTHVKKPRRLTWFNLD